VFCIVAIPPFLVRLLLTSGEGRMDIARMVSEETKVP
jgi:hypothetical protein